MCLAEGAGRNAVFLARIGYQVTAVDQSEEGLSKIDLLAKESGVSVKTVLADLQDFTIEPASWDAIVSIWCHVPPSLRESLHSSVVSGLKPGGVFILEAYHPRQLKYGTGGPPTTELMMTRDSLEQELKGLSFTILREVDRKIHEGKGHDGMSAVVQCLGKSHVSNSRGNDGESGIL